MEILSQKHCVPCEGGTPPMPQQEIQKSIKELAMPWKLAREEGTDRLKREFTFGDFTAAMRFVNRVGVVAEKEDHHPDMHIWYNRVLLVLWTHAAKGLTENDFIMAAKINELAEMEVPKK